MSPPNGHARNLDAAEAAPTIHPKLKRFRCHRNFQATSGFHSRRSRTSAALEIPFDPGVIDWRVTNTGKNGKLRGHVIPYADQRAYTDRLNALFTPAGWTRKYAI